MPEQNVVKYKLKERGKNEKRKKNESLRTQLTTTHSKQLQPIPNLPFYQKLDRSSSINKKGKKNGE